MASVWYLTSATIFERGWAAPYHSYLQTIEVLDLK